MNYSFCNFILQKYFLPSFCLLSSSELLIDYHHVKTFFQKIAHTCQIREQLNINIIPATFTQKLSNPKKDKIKTVSPRTASVCFFCRNVNVEHTEPRFKRKHEVTFKESICAELCLKLCLKRPVFLWSYWVRMVLKATVQKESSEQSLPKVISEAAIHRCS